jgi:hypothetical protein
MGFVERASEKTLDILLPFQINIPAFPGMQGDVEVYRKAYGLNRGIKGGGCSVPSCEGA